MAEKKGRDAWISGKVIAHKLAHIEYDDGGGVMDLGPCTLEIKATDDVGHSVTTKALVPRTQMRDFPIGSQVRIDISITQQEMELNADGPGIKRQASASAH